MDTFSFKSFSSITKEIKERTEDKGRKESNDLGLKD